MCIRADMMLVCNDYLLRVTLNEHHKQSHVAMLVYLRLCANGCECARVYVSQESSPTKTMDIPFELCCNSSILRSYIVMVSTGVVKHVNLHNIIGDTRRLVRNAYIK